MEQNKHKINIGTFFKKGSKFIIPSYQRGYKWGIKYPKDDKTSMDVFCDSLIDAFKRRDSEYFIEALTVVQENDTGSIVLIDGQQRTTSLYILFVALNEFDFLKCIELKYEVRNDSHVFLKNLINTNPVVLQDEDTQDIFYFKAVLKAARLKVNEITHLKLNIQGTDKTFSEFVKENVYLLFNKIPQDKAINTFIALNGLKALMKDEELIKSDLLIKSSRTNQTKISVLEYGEETLSIEWKINEDRGRLARNWDKWLYWWNRKEIKEYFGTGTHHPLYYLLVTYWNLNKNKQEDEFSFNHFKTQFIFDSKAAKNHFEGLRKLQKTFEDLYKNFYTYNFLGLTLKTSNNKELSLQYFLSKRNQISFEEYAKWSLIDATHLEIVNNLRYVNDDPELCVLIKNGKALNALDLINQKYVYCDENDQKYSDKRLEYTYRFLLLLNLLEDNSLKRKFDFSIWNNRSLEHIYPKSKKQQLDFPEKSFLEASIHCIGNLVLLYGKDNSAFGAKDVVDKKVVYFKTGESLDFKSRNLLHTLSVFSNSKWEEEQISINKTQTIAKLKKYYGV